VPVPFGSDEERLLGRKATLRNQFILRRIGSFTKLRNEAHPNSLSAETANARTRRIVAWTLVLIPLAFFAVSLLMGRRCSGVQMAWALMLVTHMPFFAFPFWAVFRGWRNLAINLGWLMFVLGEVFFFVYYASFYKQYGWPSPDLPGGIFAGVLFGRILGWLVTIFAEAIKNVIDRRWPIL
jgi:hypothetical protein